ncbi:MAG TPA: serine hydrolase domain-containing protein [Gemmatimonadaceae bacterium]
MHIRSVGCAVLAALAPFIAPASAAGQPSTADLDAIARRVMAQEHVVGASVLVAQGDRILLHKGYGFADLGLEAPAKDETVYHIVGPMMPFTGVAVLQLVERGKISLADDISKYVPEFPMQGHRVTVRQLLDHTTGIVDYHYLGDAIDGTSRQPKALDEIMALYAGRPWVNEPGTKWDWSISGFELLVTIVERVSGQSFADYVQQNILTPAKVKSTTYCDDFTLVHGLSHGYRRMGTSFVPANENDMAFNYDLRYCSTVGDLFQAWKAVRDGKLLKPETLRLMSTAEGPAAHMNASDPMAQYGLALTLNHEDNHRSRGQHGSLLGYAGSMYEFPDDGGLMVIVLTNTESQNAYAIGRALARAVLGLPPLPTPRAPAPARSLADVALSPSERAQVSGTYLVKFDKLPPELHGSFTQYRRTYRVFDENGRLMIEPLGQGAERLLKQPDGSFAMRSSPGMRIAFAMQNDRATGITMDSEGGGRPLAGDRVGGPEPQAQQRRDERH